jgi:hypothetical protein
MKEVLIIAAVIAVAIGLSAVIGMSEPPMIDADFGVTFGEPQS